MEALRVQVRTLLSLRKLLRSLQHVRVTMCIGSSVMGASTEVSTWTLMQPLVRCSTAIGRPCRTAPSATCRQR